MKGCVNQTIYVPLITYYGDQALGFEDATALVHDGLPHHSFLTVVK